MVTTQDLSLGTLWVRLLGASARWAPGEDPSLPPEGPPQARHVGLGLVAIWVVEEGPVLVCHPGKALRALKAMPPGTPIETLRQALREAGAVVREEPEPRRDSMV